MSASKGSMDVFMRTLDIAKNMMLGLNMFHGDQLGIYKAMRGKGRLAPSQLAEMLHMDERYIREWLVNQAVNGIIDYHGDGQTFSLSDDAAMVLAEESSPTFGLGAVETCIGAFQNVERIQENFRTGKGIRWGDQGKRVVEGCARFFGPQYESFLTNYWMPLIDKRMLKKLQDGDATVADVGCGYGISTMVMARAFPKAKFVGLDYDEGSIRRAIEHSKDLPNCSFSSQNWEKFSSQNGIKFDLIVFCDSFHDMAEPQQVIEQAKRCLKSDGMVLLVEPMAGENMDENRNLSFQLMSGFSGNCCLQVCKADSKGGPCLGATYKTSTVRDMWKKASFADVLQLPTPDTPFHRILQIHRSREQAQ